MTAAPEMCPESAACPRSELAKSCADIWGARAAALELGRRFSVPGVWLIIRFHSVCRQHARWQGCLQHLPHDLGACLTAVNASFTMSSWQTSTARGLGMTPSPGYVAESR